MNLNQTADVDFYVDRKGRVRDHNPWASDATAAQARADRYARARMLSSATAPVECSMEIPVAPARGNLRAHQEQYVVAVGSEDFEVAEERYMAGKPARQGDVFDQMLDQARRSKRNADPPFTKSMIAAGRSYRELTEDVHCFGAKCSATFDNTKGGSGKTDAMDAYIAAAQRLDWYHRAIGHGIAKDIRRKADVREGKVVIATYHLRDIGKKLITVRGLVDAVCLRGQALGPVLEAHGWRRGGKNVSTLRSVLCAALERMQGI